MIYNPENTYSPVDRLHINDEKTVQLLQKLEKVFSSLKIDQISRWNYSKLQ